MAMLIDLIIIAILAINIFLGYKNGLTKSLIKILSFIIAVVIAVIFFKPVSNYVIKNTEIDENIKQSVINLVSKDIKEEGKIKEETNMPKGMVNYINETVGNAFEETKTAAVNSVAENIAYTTINVGVALILFIVARIILLIITIVTDLLTDLPVLKQIDKTGGVIYGILKALLIIFGILAIISLISPAIAKTGIIIAINKSFIGSILYDNNILLNIILK